MEFMVKDVNNTNKVYLNSSRSDTSSSVTKNPPGAQTWWGKNDRNIFYTLCGELAQLEGGALIKMSTAHWLHVQGNNPPKRKTILLEPSTYIHYENGLFPKAVQGKVTWAPTSLLNAMTSNIWMFPSNSTASINSRLGHVLAQTPSHPAAGSALVCDNLQFLLHQGDLKEPLFTSTPIFPSARVPVWFNSVAASSRRPINICRMILSRHLGEGPGRFFCV